MLDEVVEVVVENKVVSGVLVAIGGGLHFLLGKGTKKSNERESELAEEVKKNRDEIKEFGETLKQLKR